MNRYDFMRQLEMLLSDITPNERKEALQFYNDYFDDAGAENEQNVIKALGSPAKVAASIKADLTGNASGEFTETGYKDSYSRNQEIMKYGQPDQNTANQENKNQSLNGAGQNGPYNNNPYSSNPYSNNGAGKNPYSNNPYGNNNSGNSQSGTNQGNSYHTNGYSGAPGKKGMSGGTLALVIILCIIGMPFLLALAAGVLGIVIGIVAMIASLFIAVAVTAFALIVVGVVILAVGISKLFIAPFGGLYLAGGGLACIGMGILFAMLTIWLCITVIPAIVKAIAGLCRKLFTNRNASRA